jgi:hypothetical protein
MRVLLAVAVAGLLACAAAPAQADPGVLGIRYDHGPQGRISFFDRVSLARRGRSVRVHGYVWGWDRSPTGSAVALGVSSRGRVQIVATAPVAFSRIIETGKRDTVRALRWVSAERMIALVGFERPQVLEIDAAAGKVVSRRSLGCREAAAAKTADGLAMLCDERLILARPGAPLRSIALPGVRAGADVYPGLAVDGDVAYVAPVGPPSIVRVDLASGAATTHALAASAAKNEALSMRTLEQLAPGKLVLGGSDQAEGERPHVAGLRIVNTATWTARRINTRQPVAEVSPFGVVVPQYEHPAQVVLYDVAGRRRATFRPRYGMSNVVVAGPFAYVKNGARRGGNHRTHVLDLRSGRKVGSVPFTTLPIFLP